ncbi:hypothetical protein HK100_000987 [Physocladia obscura]|uniref:Major facilitator superfamily (MFS) profile domain-containing protein n=1 Tax=Physocladia obscura TaxID=109957 RepID=A0AAD5SXG4_9FUNG|nr:hypothetical protein HK100_000987 [Physocladia obscura]
MTDITKTNSNAEDVAAFILENTGPSALDVPAPKSVSPKVSNPDAELEITDIQEEKPAVILSRTEFILVFVGLALAVFISALDQTIVAVALQAIAAEFKSLDKINWIGTAFFLTATAFIPVYGQLADVFGRKLTFLLAIGIFEFGSLLCGVATSMDMLIVARGVAGMGGAGVFSLTMIIIGDLTTTRDRGQYLGLIGSTYGLASIAGPLLGGVFVDHVTWRWVFYINLPIGLITVAAVLRFLRFQAPEHESFYGSLKKIDWLGTVLLVSAVICILIPIQSGGSTYAWNSPTVIVLFIVGFLLFGIFLFVEGRVAKNPVLPFALFKNQYASATFATSFFVGAAFFILVFYCPLWFQIVLGVSATQAGIHTLPLMMGMVFSSILSGATATSTGYFFPFLPAGAIITALGAGLLTTLTEDASLAKQIIFMLIAGLGVGAGFQMCIVSAQVSVKPNLLAAVTSTNNFIQTIGLAIGIAICSSLFNTNLPNNIADALTSYGLSEIQLLGNASSAIVYQDSSVLHNSLYIVPGSDLQKALVHGYLETLRTLFWLPMGFSLVWCVTCLFVKKDKIAQGTEISMGA